MHESLRRERRGFNARSLVFLLQEKLSGGRIDRHTDRQVDSYIERERLLLCRLVTVACEGRNSDKRVQPFLLNKMESSFN